MHDLSATIVAVATPPGRGGVGCVRISGTDSRRIAVGIFEPASANSTPEPGGAPGFGRLVGPGGIALDHGYLILFRAERSFTGEPTAELWPHGSPAVLAALVEAAVEAGALPAGPGEFTYRALRNGRIDLARAEAVRDLVEARTVYQARVAFAQAEGALSRRLAPLRDRLEEWIVRGEAAVEFVDESETHLGSGRLRRGIDESLELCCELLRGFRMGRLVREGASLVLTGLPNTGKSSLFNRLLAEDRAIVTELPGTTRDTLEENLDLDGIPLRLIDTAGLRDSRDPIESEGVRRAERARREADLELLVVDGSRALDPAEIERLLEGTFAVVNKSDLPEVVRLPAGSTALRVSALTGRGLDELRAELRSRLVGQGPAEHPVMTNARHARALEQARSALERAARAADDGLSEELLLEDLREAIRHLGEITGELGTEELYDRIFSTFCIGK
jgi:tRNA modification GTPase